MKYGIESTCPHGEPPGDCPLGCQIPGPADDLSTMDATELDPAPGKPWTELGYANRFVVVFGDRARFVPAWNRWLIWDGTRWAMDTTGQVARWMKSIARRMTAAAYVMQDKDKQKVALRAARHGESSSSVSGALKLASTELDIAVTPEELDADPFLLNTATGTLDLRTGHLRDHDPMDMLTKVTAAGYNPDAAGPNFSAFLERVQPDPDMRAYLARLLGHALEGRVAEHILPIFYGSGANGKSTLIGAVCAALGDYAAPADPTLLTAKSFEAHPTGVADLFGLRLAVMHEGDAGHHMAEGTVKRLTGGDTLKARRMREDFWSFTPSHTFFMLTNHKPQVGGTDEGIWRRLRLIPWNVVIPSDERDEQLPDRLGQEGDAILGWLVAGHAQWRTAGLKDPKLVLEATDAYRTESDAVGRFIADRCLIGNHFNVAAAQLFAAWQKWCATEGEEPGTQKALAAHLRRHGLSDRHTKKGTRWVGIDLQGEDSDGAGDGR